MYIQIALSLPLAILIGVVLYGIGIYCNRFLKIFESPAGNTWLNITGHILSGFLLVSSLYAVVITHGKSIFTGALLLIALYRVLNYKRPAIHTTSLLKLQEIFSIRAWLFPVFILSAAYLFIVVQHLPALKTGYPLSFHDYHYYAQVSKALGITGLENRNNSFSAYIGFPGTLLYHYLDLWATDLVCRLTGFDHFIVMLFVIYPLLLTMLFTGLAGIIALPLSGQKVWGLLILVLATAGTSIYFNFYESLPLFNNFWLRSFVGAFSGHKLFIIYAMLTLSLSQLVWDNKLAAVFWLLQLCFAYTTTLPGICGGIIIVLVIFWIRGYTDRKLLINMFTLTVFCVGYCLIFDKIFSAKPRQPMNTHQLIGLKSFIIIYSEYLIRLSVVFLPVIIIIAIGVWKKIMVDTWEKIGWLFLTSATFCSILFVTLNHQTTNSNQALYNLVPPLLIILSSVLVYRIFNATLSAVVRGTLILIITLCAGYNLYTDFSKIGYFLRDTNVYSKDYIETCLQEIDLNNKDTDIVNVVSLNDDKIIYWQDYFKQRAEFLFYSKKVMECLDLSPYNQPGGRVNKVYFNNPDNDDNPIEKWLRQNYPGHEVFDENILLDFLKSYHIKYIIITSGYRFSPLISEHLKLISCSQPNGECFYRIEI